MSAAPLLAAVPLAPLAAAALALVAAARRPAWCGVPVLAGNAAALAALIGLGGGEASVQATWLHAGGLSLSVDLRLDPLSRYMAFIVAAVSLAVNAYALGYMAREPARGFFHAAMGFFVAAMLALVLAGSLALFFAAWEAVGLASYALIAFHYRSREAAAAARQAFLLTRAGDVALLLGWLLAWRLTGTDRIPAVLARLGAGEGPPATLTLVALLLLAGALGKSAQLPLSAWLPRAMAGPTPVSALIHSSTMVAAGVYLVLRFYPLFAAAPHALEALLWIGGATALFGALVATAQADLKRVLAWSTSAQLGEMLFALGLAGPLAAAYHLATHAAFKSTLFLSAGAVDKATGTRALDRLGALARKLPLAAAAFIAAALALAGVPPLSGFWSGERILAHAAARSPAAALFMLALIALAGVYIGRAAFATFGRWRAAPAPEARPQPLSMKIGMSVLALVALALGALLAGSIERLLAFPAGPEAAIAWRAAAVACALAGITFGAWRVRVAGAAPALGEQVFALERGLERLTRAPGRAAFALAAVVEHVERRLDRSARLLACAALCAARGIDGSETALDEASRSLARSSFAMARAAQAAEQSVFSRPLDAFAALLGAAGARLREAETGRLYLYTAGLFVWVLAALLAGILFLR